MWIVRRVFGVLNKSSTFPFLGSIQMQQRNRHGQGPLVMINSFSFNRLKSSKSTKSGDGFEDLDQPIKYTTSGAAEWKATTTHGGSLNAEMPWIQPYVVSFSVGVFLLYFLALREENDVDEEMGKPIWEKVPGLEVKQLELLRQYNDQHGLPNEDIDKRLQQIKKQ